MILETVRRHMVASLAFLLALTGALAPVSVSAQTLTTIASFNGVTGASPLPTVTIDANGNLFGTTNTANSAYGTVWEIAAGSNKITTIAAFNPNPQVPGGAALNPTAGVTIDANGNLFGTTEGGGPDNDGGVWEIKAGTHSITTLATFVGPFGSNVGPSGGTLDANGNLFGTTAGGGAYGNGTVWELKAGASTVTTVYSFSPTVGAAVFPAGGVRIDAKGDLFGTTEGGGAHGDGSVWEIKAGTNSLITLASFDGPNGNHPFGGVTIDAKGDLFGTTVQGGAYGSYYGGDGTVWEIKAGTNMISTLASFSVTDTEAYGGVTIDAKGDLFGTTYGGGVNGEGTVWEIAAGGNTLTTLTSVNGVGDTSEGTSRYGPGVAIDANGNLIGATWAGGKYGDGSVWEIQGAAAVPEPSSIVLFGAGALGLALAEARRRAKSRVS